MKSFAAAGPADLEPFAGQPFVFRTCMVREGDEEVRLELELLRVARGKERAAMTTQAGIAIRTQPFSLLFRSRTSYLTGSRTARIEQPQFEDNLALLTPVTAWGEEPGYFYYEIVFN